MATVFFFLFLSHIKFSSPGKETLGPREDGLLFVLCLSWIKAMAFEVLENLILQTTDLVLLRIFFSCWSWGTLPVTPQLWVGCDRSLCPFSQMIGCSFAAVVFHAFAWPGGTEESQGSKR